MEHNDFCQLPQYKWLETTLVNSGLYKKTYQSSVPFVHIDIPKLVRSAINAIRAMHKSESNEWVVHQAIYEAALQYLNFKKLDYPFQTPPQYGTAEMLNGFKNIAPAPKPTPPIIQQTVSGDDALERENLTLREVISSRDQEIHEKDQELERMNNELQKKEGYISRLMEIGSAPAPTPIVQEIVGTDDQVNRELLTLRAVIDRKDQEIHEKWEELQQKAIEIQKKDRYISSLMETLNLAQDVMNGKLERFAL